MSPLFEWKPDQLAALKAGGDLVLTASAGTGKTTILVAKYIRELFKIIRDTPQEELERPGGSPLNRMAAITFTELAAAQLKQEIRLKLSAVMFGDDREIEQVFPGEREVGVLQDFRRDYIASLIRELDACYIGTIHSFCGRILRENFIEAGLSPAFGILAEETSGRADELQLEAANEALQAALAADEYLRALAARIGYSTLRSELIYLADRLRTDGYSRIDVDSFCAEQRVRWIDEGGKALACAGDLLRRMSAELIGLPSSSLTEKNRQKADVLGDLLLTAVPLTESVDSLLSSEAGNALAALRTMHLLTGKAPANVNELQKTYQALYDNGVPGDCPPLKSVAGIGGDEPNIRSLLAAVRLYTEAYDRRKDALDLLDFNDLLLRARDLLRDNPSVRERYHRQFSHIFVDEFQDVDPLQHEIIGLLHQPGPGRALVVVGDGKQSIYRFRGADVTSFVDIAEKVSAEGGRQLPLETNFRSNASLIGTFNPLFGHLFERERKANRFQMEPADMVAFQLHRPRAAAVEWIKLEDYDAANEGVAIVKAILRLTDGSATNRKGEPLGFGDIAVLLTTYSHLTVYEDALRRHSIPYAVEGGRGYYRQREIWDIISYLKLLWFPQDDYSLAAVLRSPFCLLSDETLLLLAREDRLDGTKLFDGDPPAGIPEEEAGRFASFKDLFLRHRGLLDRLGTAEIIEELLEETGYEAVLLSRAGGDQSTANVRKLIEMARDYESSGVNSGLQFVLDAAGRMLARETDRESQAKLGVAAGGCVRVLTIHKSKGLQFPAVVIPQLKYSGKQPNGPILYDRHAGLGVRSIDPETGETCPSPGWNRAAASINQQAEAEHLRLLYVAMTRAEEHIVLIGSEEKPRKQYVNPWQERLAAALEEAGLEQGAISLINGSQLEQIARRAQAPADLHPEIAAAKPVAVPESAADAVAGEIVDRALIPTGHKPCVFTCNVHRILKLLAADIGFAESAGEAPGEEERDYADEAVAGIAPAKPVETGRAVHLLLEQINLTSPPAEDEIAGRLRSLGIDGETAEAAHNLAQWLASGDAAEIAALRTQRETPFTVRLENEGISLYLSGTIDLIAELPGGGHWIVDYKYALPGHGEAYRKQLLLYALSLGRIPAVRPRRLSLIYLKESLLEDIQFTQDDLAALKQEIFARINQEWLSPGPDGAASP